MKNSRSIIGYTLISLIVVVAIVFVIYVFKKMIESNYQSESESEYLEVINKKGTLPIYQEVKDPNTGKWMYRISKVEFEGHTYIVLEDYGSGLLHDPDCKCQNPK